MTVHMQLQFGPSANTCDFPFILEFLFLFLKPKNEKTQNFSLQFRISTFTLLFQKSKKGWFEPYLKFTIKTQLKNAKFSQNCPKKSNPYKSQASQWFFSWYTF